MNNYSAVKFLENLFSTNGVIGHDDPNAEEKLKEKLRKLQALQTLYKEINAIIRKKGMITVTKIQAIMKLEERINQEVAFGLLQPDTFNRVGLASYLLTNNNAAMNSVVDRISKIQRVEAMPEYEETKNGVTVSIDKELNRITVHFPFRPEQKICDHLKHSGYRWAPSKGMWLGNISRYRLQNAKEVFDMVPQIDPAPVQEEDLTSEEMIAVLTGKQLVA